MNTRSLRVVAAAALVLGAALFAVGVTIERGEHAESSSGDEERIQDELDEPGTGHEEGETAGEAVSSEERGEGAEPDATIAGVDLESAPFIVAAILVSVALAVAVLWLSSPAVLGAVIAIALVFAVADVREIIVQLDEGNGGVAAIAGAVAAVHVVAAVAAGLAWRQPTEAPAT